MRNAAAAIMLISSGLAVSGVFSIAWERAPAWRAEDSETFRRGITHTLRRVDKLQPALFVLCLVSSVAFAIVAAGRSTVLSALAAACTVAVLAISGLREVPIQQKLMDPDLRLGDRDVAQMRVRWLGGHQVRTGFALAAFALLVAATLA